MKKLKLKTFSNWMEKYKFCVGDKVVKLREECELLGRFLIIQGSRPELVPKLEETTGNYEMSVVPRSLCTIDGSLYIPTDKASLMHAVERATGEMLESGQMTDNAQPEPVRVLIVDAMAVLHSMKNTPIMQTFADLQEAFFRHIDGIMAGYQEGHVIFDRYLDQSLKDKTRKKGAAISREFEIHPEMKLTMTLKELLSASRTKKSLTTMLAESLLQRFSSQSAVRLTLVYDTKIKIKVF